MDAVFKNSVARSPLILPPRDEAFSRPVLRRGWTGWRRPFSPFVSRSVWRERVRSVELAHREFALAWPVAAGLTRVVFRPSSPNSLATTETFGAPEVSARISICPVRLGRPDYEDVLFGRYERGLIVAASVFDVCWHEFGHVVTDIVAFSLVCESGRSYVEGLDLIVRQACIMAACSRRSAAASLSENARYSVGELLADAFAVAHLKGSSAPPFAQAVVQLCREAWPQ